MTFEEAIEIIEEKCGIEYDNPFLTKEKDLDPSLAIFIIKKLEVTYARPSIGLTDKNGVEIFEGSRVKPDRGEPFIVNDFIYGKGVFRSALIADGWHEFDGIYNGSQVEVI